MNCFSIEMLKQFKNQKSHLSLTSRCQGGASAAERTWRSKRSGVGGDKLSVLL